MSTDRALVFPGLVPLTPGELTAVLTIRDPLLGLAADVCGFDPDHLDVTHGSAALPSTIHEALLAVALLRRTEAHSAGEPGAHCGGAPGDTDGRGPKVEGRRHAAATGTRNGHEAAVGDRHQDGGTSDQPSGGSRGCADWTAYGGLSAGCLPTLHAAGIITRETCFRLIREINIRQIKAKETRPNGITLALLPTSEGDAARLLEVLAGADDQPWLSVDLGGGLIALSFRSDDADALTRRLARYGTAVLDRIDRAEHCPWALPEPDAFAELLADVDFHPATAAVVSPLTGKRVADAPEAYRRMLTEQWFDTASLPQLVDGLCAVDSIRAVDLVSPAASVYVSRVRELTAGRADHRLLTIAV